MVLGQGQGHQWAACRRGPAWASMQAWQHGSMGMHGPACRRGSMEAWACMGQHAGGAAPGHSPPPTIRSMNTRAKGRYRACTWRHITSSCGWAHQRDLASIWETETAVAVWVITAILPPPTQGTLATTALDSLGTCPPQGATSWTPEPHQASSTPLGQAARAAPPPRPRATAAAP